MFCARVFHSTCHPAMGAEASREVLSFQPSKEEEDASWSDAAVPGIAIDIAGACGYHAPTVNGTYALCVQWAKDGKLKGDLPIFRKRPVLHGPESASFATLPCFLYEKVTGCWCVRQLDTGLDYARSCPADWGLFPADDVTWHVLDIGAAWRESPSLTTTAIQVSANAVAAEQAAVAMLAATTKHTNALNIVGVSPACGEEVNGAYLPTNASKVGAGSLKPSSGLLSWIGGGSTTVSRPSPSRTVFERHGPPGISGRMMLFPLGPDDQGAYTWNIGTNAQNVLFSSSAVHAGASPTSAQRWYNMTLPRRSIGGPVTEPTLRITLEMPLTESQQTELSQYWVGFLENLRNLESDAEKPEESDAESKASAVGEVDRHWEGNGTKQRGEFPEPPLPQHGAEAEDSEIADLKQRLVVAEEKLDNARKLGWLCPLGACHSICHETRDVDAERPAKPSTPGMFDEHVVPSSQVPMPHHPPGSESFPPAGRPRRPPKGRHRGEASNVTPGRIS